MREPNLTREMDSHLDATEDDILEAKAAAESLTLETVVKVGAPFIQRK